MVEIEIATARGTTVRQEAAYGTERLDTADTCGDTDNGFGLLFNWNLLGDGEHTVIIRVNNVELSRASVTVTTLGSEFLRDVAGTCPVPDFPSSGGDGDAGMAADAAELCDGRRPRAARGEPGGGE